MNDYPHGGEMGRGPSNFETGTGAGINVGGFMIGALVGASLALLLAPASGDETRRRLGDTAKKIGSAAKDKFQDIRGNISDMGDESNTPGQTTFGSTRQGVGSTRSGQMPGSQPGKTTP